MKSLEKYKQEFECPQILVCTSPYIWHCVYKISAPKRLGGKNKRYFCTAQCFTSKISCKKYSKVRTLSCLSKRLHARHIFENSIFEKFDMKSTCVPNFD